MIFSLALVCVLRRVSEQLFKSRAVTMLRYARCNIVILMAATGVADVLQFLYRVRVWFVYRTFQLFPEKICHAVAAIKITMLHPSESLCYIGYTSTWLDVRSCVLMQEATTFQHLLWWYMLLAFGHCINFCICAMLRTRATFSWPICINVVSGPRFETDARSLQAMTPRKWL